MFYCASVLRRSVAHVDRLTRDRQRPLLRSSRNFQKQQRAHPDSLSMLSDSSMSRNAALDQSFNVSQSNRDIALISLKALPESESEGKNAKLMGLEFALLLRLEATLEPVDCSIDAAILP